MISLIYILFSILFIYNSYYLFLYLQEEHYYLNRFKKHIFYYYKNNIFLFLLIFLLYIDIYLFFTFLILHVLYKLIHLKKVIIKLKFTKRINRILFVYLLLYIIPQIIFKNIYVNIILHILLPINIILSVILLIPIEKCIMKKYYNIALNKLSQNKDCKKILITGSCGKTTVKNIIYNLIKENYYVLKTPKSYNTLPGILKFINEEFNNNVDILIIEAGACQKGDIDEICELIKPNIGVITEITEQHLESFKTIENIIDTKCELIKYINNNNFFIYNMDNLYLKNKFINTKYIGITSSCVQINKMLPNLEFIYNNTIYKSSLLGIHQITNILISFEVINCLEKLGFVFKKEELLYNLEQMKCVKNRLEYQKVNNIDIYNDSYNSNRIGFINAIELLSHANNKKAIITPGIVELGKCEKIINEEIAYKVSKVFDEIYLVSSEVTIYYINVFKKLNIKYYLFDKFIDAYNHLLNNNLGELISLLIENDVMDIYKER